MKKLFMRLIQAFSIPEIPQGPTYRQAHEQDVKDYVTTMQSLYGQKDVKDAINRDLIIATRLDIPLAIRFYTEALKIININ